MPTKMCEDGWSNLLPEAYQLPLGPACEGGLGDRSFFLII